MYAGAMALPGTTSAIRFSLSLWAWEIFGGEVTTFNPNTAFVPCTSMQQWYLATGAA